jgi:hypothetical protein
MTGILEHRDMTFLTTTAFWMDMNTEHYVQKDDRCGARKAIESYDWMGQGTEERSSTCILSSRWCFYRCSLHLISVQSEQQSRNRAAIAAVLSFSVLFLPLLLSAL